MSSTSKGKVGWLVFLIVALAALAVAAFAIGGNSCSRQPDVTQEQAEPVEEESAQQASEQSSRSGSIELPEI